MYKYNEAGAIVRISDESVIPTDPENRDYQAVLQWVAEGNEIEPLPTPSPKELADQAMIEAKQLRQIAVSQIKVATAAGNIFDGDEESQTRMSRAIVSMNNEETTTWVLADNTAIEATRAELYEALRLAGQAQTAIWLKPYETTEAT